MEVGLVAKAAHRRPPRWIVLLAPPACDPGGCLALKPSLPSCPMLAYSPHDEAFERRCGHGHLRRVGRLREEGTCTVRARARRGHAEHCLGGFLGGPPRRLRSAQGGLRRAGNRSPCGGRPILRQQPGAVGGSGARGRGVHRSGRATRERSHPRRNSIVRAGRAGASDAIDRVVGNNVRTLRLAWSPRSREQLLRRLSVRVGSLCDSTGRGLRNVRRSGPVDPRRAMRRRSLRRWPPL